MTWLNEFGQILYHSAQLKGIVPVGSLEAARSALLAGDPEKLLVAFPGGVRIDDPRAGRIEGSAALEAYCDQSHGWLQARNAEGRLIASTEGPSRVVGEFEVDLTEGERTFILPIGVVVERLDPHLPQPMAAPGPSRSQAAAARRRPVSPRRRRRWRVPDGARSG